MKNFKYITAYKSLVTGVIIIHLVFYYLQSSYSLTKMYIISQ